VQVKIGVIPGQWTWEGGGAAFLAFAERCEVLGWDSLWLSDRLVSDQMNLEPVTALAAVAARTSTLKFGTSVLALAIRNPALLAKELATVDYLAGGKGRLLPAMGLGGDDEREYEAAGGRKQERAGRTDEAIGLLRRLWTEDHVTHHGRYYHLTDVSIRPRPLFQPYPPLWIGGRSEFAWRRVAAQGDGWLSSNTTPHEVAAGIAGIRQVTRENGRHIEDDHFGVLLPAYLATSREEAQRHFNPGRRFRNDMAPTSYACLGDADDIMATLREYVAAGATKFVLRLACSEAEAPEQLAMLAGAVVRPVHTGQIPL